MSTHFHLIVKTHYIKQFITTYKLALTKHLNYKQGRSGPLLDIKYRELANQNEMLIGLNYTLKNPVHHNISPMAFNYPYSSIGCYFKDELHQKPTEGVKINSCPPSALDSITRRNIFGSFKVLSEGIISSFEMIDPQVFISSQETCSLYSTPKNFLYQINKPLSEEIEKFGSDVERYVKSATSISLGSKLLDWDVCQLIDSAIFPKKVGELTEDERAELQKNLRQFGINPFQFKRCTE